jgi:cell division protein FtsB
VLILALVILGTIGLLVLNTVIAADSFRAEELVQRNAELAVAEQELRRQVADGLAPEALAEAARDLGMIPAGAPGFIIVGPDGAIVIQGAPVPAGTR